MILLFILFYKDLTTLFALQFIQKIRRKRIYEEKYFQSTYYKMNLEEYLQNKNDKDGNEP